MIFKALCSVFVVAQLLVAALAVPASFQDSAIEERSLDARSPLIKFHLCTSTNYYGDCYHLSTEPLTTSFSNSGCFNLKPGAASTIQSIRVLDTWNYAVEIRDAQDCGGEGVTVMDSDNDLGDWNNRAKSVKVWYIPIPYDSYPNNAVGP